MYKLEYITNILVICNSYSIVCTVGQRLSQSINWSMDNCGVNTTVTTTTTGFQHNARHSAITMQTAFVATNQQVLQLALTAVAAEPAIKWSWWTLLCWITSFGLYFQSMVRVCTMLAYTFADNFGVRVRFGLVKSTWYRPNFSLKLQ